MLLDYLLFNGESEACRRHPLMALVLLFSRLHYVFGLLLSLQIKWLIRGCKEGGSLRVQERFVAGSLAGATAQTIIYPMEVCQIKASITRMHFHRKATGSIE